MLGGGGYNGCTIQTMAINWGTAEYLFFQVDAGDVLSSCIDKKIFYKKEKNHGKNLN